MAARCSGMSGPPGEHLSYAPSGPVLVKRRSCTRWAMVPEWIAGQVEEPLGAHGRSLLDFYHVGEYLAAAAQALGARDRYRCAVGHPDNGLEDPAC